jgi:hypothetical protein
MVAGPSAVMLAASSATGSSTGISGLIGQLLDQFVKSGQQDVLNLVNSYLLTTVDTTRPGGHPLTGNPTLAGLAQDVRLAGDALLGLALVALAVRGMLDRSVESQYDLRSALPRGLVALVLMNASLTLTQMAIDLSNALSSFAADLSSAAMPWSAPLSSSAVQDPSLAADLFQVVVVLALVVVLAILGFAYVVRMAVLEVLIVSAPLAGLALILPATRGLARAWARLFVVAVFMQPAQLLVLSVAAATGLASGSGLAADIVALAALWVCLKVPAFLARAVASQGPVGSIGHVMALHARRLPLPPAVQGW